MSADETSVGRSPVYDITYETTTGAVHAFRSTMGNWNRCLEWAHTQGGGLEKVTPHHLFGHMAWQHASNEARAAGEVSLPFQEWLDGIVWVDGEEAPMRPTTGVPSGT